MLPLICLEIENHGSRNICTNGNIKAIKIMVTTAAMTRVTVTEFLAVLVFLQGKCMKTQQLLAGKLLAKHSVVGR